MQIKPTRDFKHMMKLAVDKACHKANRRLASLQCSGSGAMEEEEMELQFGGTFSMSLGGCAPGKSAPTSTTVRLVCVLASEGWANSGQSRSLGPSCREAGSL